MADGININNLEGAVKAFALAADQNNDLKIDEKEIKLFNQFINGANLRQDEGLKLEQGKVNISNDPKDIKKAQKEEAKMYTAYFGKDEVDKVKADEGEANRRVITAFKELKGVKSPQMLNDAIAGRPDMADYAGDAEGYKKALDNWADGVENALKKSITQSVNEHTTNVGNEVKFTVAAFAEKLSAEIQMGNAIIIGEIGKAQDGIIKAVQTAEGHIVRAVVNQANKIIRVVEKEADLIHMHMDWNTGAIMDHTTKVGQTVMENSNANHAATRKNSDINAEMVMNNSDRNHRKTQGVITQEGIYDTISDQFNANINKNGRVHTVDTIARLQNMFKDVRNSNISDEIKTNILIELNNYARSNEIFNDKELDDLEAKIKEATGALEANSNAKNTSSASEEELMSLGLLGLGIRAAKRVAGK